MTLCDGSVQHGPHDAVDVGSLSTSLAAGVVDGAHVGRSELVEAAVADGGHDPVADGVGCSVPCLRAQVAQPHLEVGVGPLLDGGPAGVLLAAFEGALLVALLALDLGAVLALRRAPTDAALGGDGDAAPRPVGVPSVVNGGDPAPVGCALVLGAVAVGAGGLGRHS